MAKPTVKQFQNRIWTYYKKNARDLPWRHAERAKSHAKRGGAYYDPYRVLISEIMLQQTQVSRVLKKYPEFLRAFPNFLALARAPLSKVLRLWQGMGYNRRAVALRSIAKIVTKEYGGRLPNDLEVLEQLPGIGHYTARAVVCFAVGTCEPFLETNIRRVFIHFFHSRGKNISDQTLLIDLKRTQPSKRQREWYLALMDYGAMLGQKRENANRRSRHYRKQSKFEGSNRQLRGMIVKMLVENKIMDKKAIIKGVAETFRLRNNLRRLKPAATTLHTILATLTKEGFIIKRESLYRLR
ncbi:MAG: A/G-specific adenine glycosylase [bacterium]|nr:A/G-specific adenine glycosylase [bacterium]